MPHKELDIPVDFELLNRIRFIRIGDKIIYDEEGNYKVTHDELAKMTGATEKKGGKLLIDDGGWMETKEGKINFIDDTNSCVVRGNVFLARQITIDRAKQILGEEKVYD